MLMRLIRALFASPKKTSSKPSNKTFSTPAHKQKAPRERPALPSQNHHLNSPIHGICYVVDGDTIRIGKHSLRLAGIDAPELDHPWGNKAKWHLVNLCKGKVVKAELDESTSYDRLVATCYLPDGRDLSAEMVSAGYALDWPKFSKGKYASLEPEGIRKKHWKAVARQRGDMDTYNKERV